MHVNITMFWTINLYKIKAEHIKKCISFFDLIFFNISTNKEAGINTQLSGFCNATVVRNLLKHKEKNMLQFFHCSAVNPENDEEILDDTRPISVGHT